MLQPESDAGGSDAATSPDTSSPSSDSGQSPDVDQDAKVDAGPIGPRFLGADATNRLVKFTGSAPGTVEVLAITGMETGETVAGMDVRPADKTLFAIGSTSRLYLIDGKTAAASPIGAVFTTLLSGTSFGMDFNPSVDRIRVVSNTGQNFRVNPNDGTFIGPDTALTFASGDVNVGTPSGDGLAYVPSNPASDAGPTTFLIDESRKLLCAFGANANQGTVSTLGSLGVALGVSSQSGFDIVRESGVDNAYMVMNVGGAQHSTLYRVDLKTGAATSLGEVGGSPLRALTHEL